MKYAAFSLNHDPSPRVGVLGGERVVELRALIGSQWKGRGPLPSSLLELIDGGPRAWQRIASLAEGTLRFLPLTEIDAVPQSSDIAIDASKPLNALVQIVADRASAVIENTLSAAQAARLRSPSPAQ